jgi:hypothetical protein
MIPEHFVPHEIEIRSNWNGGNRDLVSIQRPTQSSEEKAELSEEFYTKPVFSLQPCKNVMCCAILLYIHIQSETSRISCVFLT